MLAKSCTFELHARRSWHLLTGLTHPASNDEATSRAVPLSDRTPAKAERHEGSAACDGGDGSSYACSIDEWGDKLREPQRDVQEPSRAGDLCGGYRVNCQDE